MRSSSGAHADTFSSLAPYWTPAASTSNWSFAPASARNLLWASANGGTSAHVMFGTNTWTSVSTPRTNAHTLTNGSFRT